MALEIGSTVSGKVIRISTEGVFVSLPEGNTGFIPAARTGAAFSVGETIIARIVTRSEGGFELAVISARVEMSTDPFEKEFHRLNHVLQTHAPQPAVPRGERDPLLEERLEEWIKNVEAGLIRLRKHRGKRLNETFDEQGGRESHAQRDRRHR